MEIVAVPPPPRARAGTLLAAAYTPQGASGQLVRDVLTGYRASACGGWELIDPCSTQHSDHGVDGDPEGTVVSAMPFDVMVGETCSTFGLDPEILQQRAQDRLEIISSAAIAHELWTGEQATKSASGDPDADWSNNPRLAAGDDVTDLTPSGGSVEAKVGLAMLEDALADMLDGQPGVVHCTKGVATLLDFGGGLYRQGDLVLTILDTRIIADAGYPGTGPDGSTPDVGESWMYATAQPTVRRGPTYVEPTNLTEALDRAVNTVHYDAHQLAWAAFPCGVVAVRITTNEGVAAS